MRPDDESLLTAYLDGELGPDRRPALESALRSRPALDGLLAELAAVRDLVESLPRPPVPVDLAPAIVARIGRRRPGEFVRIGPWRRSHLRWASVVGAAALLLIAVAIGLLSEARSAPGARPRPREAVSVAQRAPEAPRPTVEIATRSVGAGIGGAQDVRAVRALLDDPNLRTIYLVTDRFDGLACAQTDRLVRETPRTDPAYCQITVSQGIVIDPRHPAEATVFALVMDDREREQLQEKLNRAFPEAVEETGVDPTVVTRLARLGQIYVCPGTPAGSTLPIASTNQGQALVAAGPDRERTPAEKGPTPSPRSDRSADDRSSRRGSSSLVLVWVTRGDRGRPGHR